jgi:DUF971 family protein
MPVQPEQIELIGDSVAIRWNDGLETFYPMDLLRAVSPSAENRGEPDLLGNIIGGSSRTNYRGVRVDGWERVGGYACRFIFSDGHRTGIYSDHLMLELWRQMQAQEAGGESAGG